MCASPVVQRIRFLLGMRQTACDKRHQHLRRWLMVGDMAASSTSPLTSCIGRTMELIAPPSEARSVLPCDMASFLRRFFTFTLWPAGEAVDAESVDFLCGAIGAAPVKGAFPPWISKPSSKPSSRTHPLRCTWRGHPAHRSGRLHHVLDNRGGQGGLEANPIRLGVVRRTRRLGRAQRSRFRRRLSRKSRPLKKARLHPHARQLLLEAVSCFLVPAGELRNRIWPWPWSDSTLQRLPQADLAQRSRHATVFLLQAVVLSIASTRYPPHG